MEPIKNIVLTGFMMAGKSCIGKALAEITGYQFYDTDEMIVVKEGRTVNDIFEKNGEEYFRKIETDIIRKASKFKKCILSTGGGVVVNKENIDLLKENGVIVNLKITPDVIKRRLGKERLSRPLIKNLELGAVLEKLKKRERFYEICDYQIEVSDKKTPKEHAEEIIRLLKEKGEI